MKEMYERTSLLLGEEGIEKLNRSSVCVFGVGGVGGYVVEALVRAGVGKIAIVDNDEVAPSNLNRQIIATVNTIGRKKTDVMRERILSINPDCEVTVFPTFYLKDTEFDFTPYDYVVDAIDTVTGKIGIIKNCYDLGIPVVSSMGTGNKLDPTKLVVTDITKTKMCPLAKVMRRLCREQGVKKLKVVYSEEEPVYRGEVPGSVSFVPSVAGLMIAGVVVKDLCTR